MAEESLIVRDLAALWHPCSQMRDYRAFPPIEVVGAAGCRLHLADGRRILDGISSWWCKALGHGHPRLRQALHDQAERFEHVILAGTTNAGVVALCERLLAMANGHPPRTWGASAPPGRLPGHFGKVFFADNGSTAVEVALKLAFQAQAQRGQPQRTAFAALSGGYHGETVGALSVGDCGLYKDTFTPLLFPCAMLGPLPLRRGPEDPRWLDAAPEWPALEAQLAALAPRLAAVIYEPVLQGAGGMRIHSPDLLRRLRGWADAHGVYLIADEIAAGMGRCGAMLASHLAPAALPDFAVLSKGLTGGFLPLAVVLTSDAVAALFDAEWHEGRAFLHSNTYAGNAVAVAVADAALAVFADEGVLGQVAQNGPLLRHGLTELARTRPWLAGARGVGMVAAVDLRHPDGGPLPTHARTGHAVHRQALARGALLRPLGDTMYLLPPLVATAAEIEELLGILAASLDAVCA